MLKKSGIFVVLNTLYIIWYKNTVEKTMLTVSKSTVHISMSLT